MKKVLAILMAALLTVGLVACGGAGSEPATPGEPSSGASSTPADASAPGSDTAAETPNVDAIVAKGKLVMMTNATFPPYEYVKDGVVTGVDADLAQKIADELGVELEILDMDFDLLIDALNSGKGDLVAAGMSITPERQENVDFSIPYVDSTLLIVVPTGSAITGPDDLAGLTISVQESTTSDLYVTDNVEGANVLRFKDAVEAGNAVKTGKADVAVIDQMTAQNVVNASPDELELLGEALAQEQYAMAIGKDKPDLMAVVNKVLQEAVDADEVNGLITHHMENSKEA